jgi:acyl carrier protein
MSGSETVIREVLEANGRLPVSALTLSDDDDLYQQGLTSHASVNVMLALEDAFDVEFPDVLLRRDTFKSVAAIRSALASLGVDPESSDRVS